MTLKTKIFTKRYDEGIEDIQAKVNQWLKKTDLPRDHLVDIKINERNIMIVWDEKEIAK